jgi:hypothetical protein
MEFMNVDLLNEPCDPSCIILKPINDVRNPKTIHSDNAINKEGVNIIKWIYTVINASIRIIALKYNFVLPVGDI